MQSLLPLSQVSKLGLKFYLWLLVHITIYLGTMLNNSFGGVIVLLFTVASVLVLLLLKVSSSLPVF